jgi:hypothetical protein
MFLKKWFKKNIAAVSIAFSNVEKNVFGQKGEDLTLDIEKRQRHTQGMLADSLLNGKITEEVKRLRWRTYKVLKATYGNTVILEGYDENENPIYRLSTKNDKTLLKKINIDNFDDFELEMVFENKAIENSVNDIINVLEDEKSINLIEYLIKNKVEKPLVIDRKNYPRFYIENYTKKINIRKITDDERMLEFYISKYPDDYNKNSGIFLNQIKKLVNSELKNINFLNFDEVSFVTNNTLGAQDFLLFTYGDITFNKIIEFDGNYVIKFNSKIIKNGEDILINYIDSELEKKYNNKEKK